RQHGAANAPYGYGYCGGSTVQRMHPTATATVAAAWCSECTLRLRDMNQGEARTNRAGYGVRLQAAPT
ncbi:MAG: hypothetical protein ACLFVO_11475, partial [Chloroflexaceae bacterium]